LGMGLGENCPDKTPRVWPGPHLLGLCRCLKNEYKISHNHFSSCWVQQTSECLLCSGFCVASGFQRSPTPHLLGDKLMEASGYA
jgi:hypothetical protein